MESSAVQAINRTPKQLFQTHITQLESIYTNNNECYILMTKNITSFISVLESFKTKLQTLFLSSSTSDLPLIVVIKSIFQNYYVNITTLIDNLKLINQGLDAPFKSYQTSFTKIKQLKDLQNKVMTVNKELNTVKHSYFKELRNFQMIRLYQGMGMEEQTDESIIARTRVINKIKDYEKEYKANVREINNKLEIYNNQGNTILQEIQREEQVLQSSFQLQIKAFVNHWINKTESDSQFIPQLKTLVEGDDRNSVRKGNEDVYKVCEIDKFEFEPYEIEELKKLNSEKSKVRMVEKKLHDFICICKKEFSDIAKDYDVDLETKKQELMNMCNKVLDIKHKGNDNERSSVMSINNTPIDLNSVLSYLNNKELRWFFLMYLNYQRTKGQFELTNKELFKGMGIIMKYIINIANKEKDFPSMRITLILSQTYYALNLKKQKIYLIRYLDNHSLFKEKEFWRFYFEENIKMELNTFNNEQYQNESQKDRMKNNMIYSKIMAGCHNMMEFGNKKEFVKDIAKEFAEKFELDEDSKNMIMIMVNEVQMEEKAQMDQSLELKSRESRTSSKESLPGIAEEVRKKEVKGEKKNEVVKKEENNNEGKKDDIIKEDNVINEVKVQENINDDKKENVSIEKVNKDDIINDDKKEDDSNEHIKENMNSEDKKEDVSNEHIKENMNNEDKKEDNINDNDINKEPLKEDNKQEINNKEQLEEHIINEVNDNELQNNEV